MTDDNAINGQSEINASVTASFESVGRTLDALTTIDENQFVISQNLQKSVEDLYGRIGRLHLWMTMVLVMQVVLAVGLVLT